MAWLAVNSDNVELIFESCPKRKNGYWDTEYGNLCSGTYSIVLPKRSIKKLIGKELTWENEPYEYIDKVDPLQSFDFEKVKNGELVCTTTGKMVRILCADREFKDWSIVALVKDNDGKEIVRCYHEKGESDGIGDHLMMVKDYFKISLEDYKYAVKMYLAYTNKNF